MQQTSFGAEIYFEYLYASDDMQQLKLKDSCGDLKALLFKGFRSTMITSIAEYWTKVFCIKIRQGTSVKYKLSD